MKQLLSEIEEINLHKFMCYTDFDYDENSITIKKSNESYSSFIETKELLRIYKQFTKRKDLNVKVLENGDIFIKKISNLR